MPQDANMMAALAGMERALAEKEKEVQLLRNTIIEFKRTLDIISPNALPKTTEYTGMAIGAAAKKLMQELKRDGMSTREIADGLLERGFRTTSKNFTMTVYSVLTQDTTFKRNKDTSLWSVAPGAKH